jgi:ribonuclease BN (tRNA processing enzyme)
MLQRIELRAFVAGTGSESTAPSVILQVSQRGRYSHDENPLQQVLFNCCECITRTMTENPTKLAKLDTLACTSSHPSVVSGLPGLVFHLSDRGAAELAITGPRPLQSYVSAVSSFAGRAHPRLKVAEVSALQPCPPRVFKWASAPACSLVLIAAPYPVAGRCTCGHREQCKEPLAASQASLVDRLVFVATLRVPSSEEPKCAAMSRTVESGIASPVSKMCCAVQNSGAGERTANEHLRDGDAPLSIDSDTDSSSDLSTSSSSSDGDSEQTAPAASNAVPSSAQANTRDFVAISVVVLDCQSVDELELLAGFEGEALRAALLQPGEHRSQHTIWVIHVGAGPVVHSRMYSDWMNGPGCRAAFAAPPDVTIQHCVVSCAEYDPRRGSVGKPPPECHEAASVRTHVDVAVMQRRTHFPAAMQQAIRLHEAEAGLYSLPTSVATLDDFVSSAANVSKVCSSPPAAVVSATHVSTEEAKAMAIQLYPLDMIQMWPAIENPVVCPSIDIYDASMPPPRVFTRAITAALRAECASKLTSSGLPAAELPSVQDNAIRCMPCSSAADKRVRGHVSDDGANARAAAALRGILRRGPPRMVVVTTIAEDAQAIGDERTNVPLAEQDAAAAAAASPTASRAVLAVRQSEGPPRITFLGTGAAAPSKLRSCSGLLIDGREDGDGGCSRIMLDCGEGCVPRLSWAYGHCRSGAWGAAMRSIEAIWVSHMHADHHSGLLSLLWHRAQSLADAHASGVVPPLRIYGPAALGSLVEAYAALVCAHAASPPMLHDSAGCSSSFPAITAAALVSFSPIVPDVDVPILGRSGGLPSAVFRSVRVDHCKDAYGVVLAIPSPSSDIPCSVVIYSGDTRPCDRLITAAGHCITSITSAAVASAVAAAMAATAWSPVGMGQQGVPFPAAPFAAPLGMSASGIPAGPAEMAALSGGPWSIGPHPHSMLAFPPMLMPPHAIDPSAFQLGTMQAPLPSDAACVTGALNRKRARGERHMGADGDLAAAAAAAMDSQHDAVPLQKRESSGDPDHVSVVPFTPLPWLTSSMPLHAPFVPVGSRYAVPPPVLRMPPRPLLTPPPCPIILLVHEATMNDDRADDARRKRHSTVGEALDVSRRLADVVSRAGGEFAGVVLTHFSQRYPSLPVTVESLPAHSSSIVGTHGGRPLPSQAPLPPHLFAFDGLTLPLGPSLMQAAARSAAITGRTAAVLEATRSNSDALPAPPAAAAATATPSD